MTDYHTSTAILISWIDRNLVVLVILAVTFSLLLLFGFFLRRRNRLTISNTISALIFCQITILAYSTLSSRMNIDEFEHLHSTWLILEGSFPYVDFFQHHHPLLWYTFLPIISVFQDSIATIYVSKTFAIAISIGFFIVVFEITKRTTQHLNGALVTISILLSMSVFSMPLMQIRPDVLQCIFCLLAFLFYVQNSLEPTTTKPILAALSWFIGFLFLQKAVFFLIPFLSVWGLSVLQKRSSFKSLVLFISVVGLMTLITGICIWALGVWKDYLLFNWILNLAKSQIFPWWDNFLHPFHGPINRIQLVVLILSLVFVALQWREVPSALKDSVLIGIGIFSIVIMTPSPRNQYFLICWPLLFSAVGYVVSKKISNAVRRPMKLVFCSILLLIPSGYLLTRAQNFKLNDQLIDLDYVLQNSTQNEVIIDPLLVGNVFRSDAHYFWFASRFYRYYVEVTSNPNYDFLLSKNRADLDTCRMIGSNIPLMIFDRDGILQKCSISHSLYIPVPQHKDLYISNIQYEK